MKEEEIQKAIQEGLAGNFLPIGIILGLCSVVIILFVFILKIYRNNNEKRHNANEEIMNELSKSSINLEKIVAIHEHEIKRLSS